MEFKEIKRNILVSKSIAINGNMNLINKKLILRGEQDETYKKMQFGLLEKVKNLLDMDILECYLKKT